MNKTITFHYHGTSGASVRMSPSGCYLEGEYDKVRVRIYAAGAPIRDASFEILADGESLFTSLTSVDSNGVPTGTSNAVIVLPANTNGEELADDFNSETLGDGAWVYCNMLDAGGGSNFAVELELEQLSEDEQPD